MNSPTSARDAASRSFINLWLAPLGLEPQAHPSIEDALDDVAEPATDATYLGTLICKDGSWVQIDLSAPAQIYAARTTEEWLYTLRQTEAHGDKVAS